MFRNFKIRTIIIITFIFVTIIVSTGGILYFYLASLDILKNQVQEQLEITVLSRATYVSDFLEGQVDKVEIIGTHYGGFTNGELREIVDLQEEFYEIFVLSSSGKVIFSSDGSQIGKDKSNDDYFVEGKKGVFIKDAYFSETTGRDSIAVSIPFNSGVLVARIEMIDLNKILVEQGVWGETGETYLINKEYYMITPSRFKENTFLNEKVDTLSARNCFNKVERSTEHIGHEAIATTYPDYRGIPVLGTHIYIPEMEWCLLAEYDESEMLSAEKAALARTSLILIFSIILFVSIIGFFVARHITGPLYDLLRSTKIIKRGNLDHKAANSSKDEAGQLAHAFNEMTKAIKQSRAEVDRKVIKQTQVIIDQQRVTEKTMHDLEKINKFMTGRELRMIELKKEIERLKNQG